MVLYGIQVFAYQKQEQGKPMHKNCKVEEITTVKQEWL